MIIGIPKEIKDNEYRVGIVPGGVRELTKRGHTVLIEAGASAGSGIDEEEYKKAGADLIVSREEIFFRANMIIKVKEPIEAEYDLLREGQILYAYLHLAPNPTLTRILLERKVIGVAYETIEAGDGLLPLLVPMSEIAGKMSIQVGAYCLQKNMGGNGILLGGVPGVMPGKVLILGAGVVGCQAASVAIGMGADVTVMDINIDRLRQLENLYGNCIKTLFSTEYNIDYAIHDCDLLIGAVLIHGAKAPHLIRRHHLKSMKKGAVVVDVAVDQGGCIETCHPTTHSNPTYIVDDVVHYCVANIPGAVAHTSTFALTNVTLPYACRMADMGVEALGAQDYGWGKGVNVYKGYVTCEPVASSLGLEYFPLSEIIRGV